MEMWNNPSCSKCAGARARLDAADVGYRIRPYLDEPPSAEELTEVLRRLGAEPWDICRTGEAAAAGLGLSAWGREAADRERWIAAMVAHPSLIQRPILIFDDGTALVARTPEALDAAVEKA
ncbi:ArsC/Spx/MgsR family protein [Phytomonospora endophytica]|uniref:Arsenate reductase n=1 Tax=Phytomonospora endophytica TaxID=714109 RepID=A0A841FWZ2_9ACTN|nr:ArsC/Spx/MgsR family protein [Phytomonospora endophytica]MBB6036999.1 arsenate reductase [Phytomonospora endophytica]GIG69457.1 arsenate reductase [Phytomonospora endophytica]